MAGEFDAAGTVIDGALIGAAVEEANCALGSDRDGQTGTPCLNCGARMTGAFCANCGQQAHVHRTLSAIWHDILHSVLHFDGKLWRTLPMLAFKPGELTRRYVHGERAKFVSPMAMFLFAIFLMFAVFSFGGSSSSGSSDTPDIGWRADMAEEAKKLDKDIGALTKKLQTTDMDAKVRKEAMVKLDDMKSDRNGISFATTGLPIYDDVGARIDSGGPVKISSGVNSSTGLHWLDRTLNQGGVKLMQNPSLTFYKLQSNGYKFAWLLIPLSLPFVWLVTLGVRGHRFYDHAVFTTYSITFMCFLFIIASVTGWLMPDSDTLDFLFLLIPPLHLYKQLRHSYGLSRGGTILRMIPLLISIVIVATLFLLILIMLGML